MNKIVSKILLSFGVMIGTFLLISAPTYASVSCPQGSVRSSANTYAECNTEETTGDDALMSRIRIIINVVLGVLGLISVAMIIVGGVTFTSSQGNPDNVKKGKDMILYSIIGLVVALLAFAIVNFVLVNIFGKGIE